MKRVPSAIYRFFSAIGDGYLDGRRNSEMTRLPSRV